MAVQIPFPLPATGYALNSKVRVNLDFLVDKFNEFNSGTATWDNVSVGTANNLTGTLTFYNASNANYLSVKAGATAANITYTLPEINPANPAYQFLMCNAAGVMHWSALNYPDTGLVGNQLLYVDGAATIKEITAGSGTKVLVNSSPPQYFDLLGTSNQVVVTPNVGNFTLSAPQNLDTSANFQVASIRTGAGSITNAAVRLNAVNTGIYMGSASEMDFSIAGSLYAALDTSGNWFVTGQLRGAEVRCTSNMQFTNGGSTVTIQALGTSFGDYTLILPPDDGTSNQVLTTNGTGTLTWTTPSSTGANTALSNLASVAINTTLVSDTDNTDDLGSSSIRWKDLWLSGNVLVNATATRTFSATVSQILLEGTDASSSSQGWVRNSNNANGVILNIGKSRGTTVGSTTSVSSGDTIGEIRFYAATGSALEQGAIIRAIIDNTPGSADVPTRLVFLTASDGNASPTERLRIDSTGLSTFTGDIKFAGTNTTGAGSASLSTNSPAITNTAPYTWIKVITFDGSTAYIPCWK